MGAACVCAERTHEHNEIEPVRIDLTGVSGRGFGLPLANVDSKMGEGHGRLCTLD